MMSRVRQSVSDALVAHTKNQTAPLIASSVSLGFTVLSVLQLHCHAVLERSATAPTISTKDNAWPHQPASSAGLAVKNLSAVQQVPLQVRARVLCVLRARLARTRTRPERASVWSAPLVTGAQPMLRSHAVRTRTMSIRAHMSSRIARAALNAPLRSACQPQLAQPRASARQSTTWPQSP